MSKQKILIIEDDPHIAQLEADYLTSEGFETETCATGPSGLARALETPFNLIVLDLMLPGKDGFHLCQEIRSQLDIPILIVSARIEDMDKIRALGLGADDYLTKPFSPAELVARVKAHLARYQRLVGKNPESETLQIKGLMISPASHRVSIDGKDVLLTGKEFELLYFLASNPDRVFSREQIFDHIWGIDHYGDIGTVAVHIQKIRKKIEKDPTEPNYVETVWGIGYRFNSR